MGADAITLGNHAYRHREVYELPRSRGANRAAGELPEGQSRARGTRWWSATACGSACVNLSGHAVPRGGRARRSPRRTRCWPSCAAAPTHVLVDMHAEATSEKVAMGWHLDGRVTACVGTHTHVPTADARVLPGRHRLHHRRGHDRPARRRDRGEARAGARALPDDDQRALRDLGRGSVAERAC